MHEPLNFKYGQKCPDEASSAWKENSAPREPPLPHIFSSMNAVKVLQKAADLPEGAAVYRGLWLPLLEDPEVTGGT